MKRLISMLLALCLSFGMVACSSDNGSKNLEQPVNYDSLMEESDGTAEFQAGNLKFRIPEAHSYYLSQSESGNFTLLNFDGSNMVLSIYTQDVSSNSSSVCKDYVSVYKDSAAEKHKGCVLSDTYIGKAGGFDVKLTIYVYEEGERTDYVLSYIFTDSYYLYDITAEVIDVKSIDSAAFIQMISESEYVGPDRRFDAVQ